MLLGQAASQGTLLLHVHQSIPDTVIMSQSLLQQLFSHSLKLIKSRAFFQEITLIIQGFNKALKIKYLQLEEEGRGGVRGKGGEKKHKCQTGKNKFHLIKSNTNDLKEL